MTKVGLIIMFFIESFAFSKQLYVTCNLKQIPQLDLTYGDISL